MNAKTRLLIGVLLLSLLYSGQAQAMAILDFVKLNDDDEATYVTSLVEGASKMLKAQGQTNQAQKAVALFKNSTKQGGVNQFALNLKTLNGLNNRNAINPNNRAHVYDVEDAMELTLKDYGIIVPTSYLLTINRNFQPSGPPRSHTPGQ
jgi:hypothetical protein